jgi:glycosyltransferase involved in cell wall biosynthesis
MKIAQIAPLIESVPPKLYGGTERVVSYLTEELVRQGHDVTLFASGDSVTSAELVPCSGAALRRGGRCLDPLPVSVMMLDRICRRMDEFDILHFHTDFLHYPLVRDRGIRALTTLHGRLDLPDLHPLYRHFSDLPVVSISYHQRRPMPPVRWAGNVYHGLPLDLLPFSAKGAGGYLAFLGRICPEKRLDRAIAIALRAGLPLRVAAKVDPVDRDYFESEIAPLLDHPLIEFIGEIGERDKGEFLGGARALLFPIDWPEPFGLVMIEAMACGTPVIAYDCGSVREVVEPGLTGFIVGGVEEAAAAVANVGALDRRLVRRRFERRFSVERMAREYVGIYTSLAPSRPVAAEQMLSA